MIAFSNHSNQEPNSQPNIHRTIATFWNRSYMAISILAILATHRPMSIAAHPFVSGHRTRENRPRSSRPRTSARALRATARARHYGMNQRFIEHHTNHCCSVDIRDLLRRDGRAPLRYLFDQVQGLLRNHYLRPEDLDWSCPTDCLRKKKSKNPAAEFLSITPASLPPTPVIVAAALKA